MLATAVTFSPPGPVSEYRIPRQQVAGGSGMSRSTGRRASLRVAWAPLRFLHGSARSRTSRCVAKHRSELCTAQAWLRRWIGRRGARASRESPALASASLRGKSPGVFAEVGLFNPAAFAWRSATSMTTPRHGIFAAVYENLVFLAGGATQQGLGATDTHEVFVVGA